MNRKEQQIWTKKLDQKLQWLCYDLLRLVFLLFAQTSYVFWNANNFNTAKPNELIFHHNKDNVKLFNILKFWLGSYNGFLVKNRIVVLWCAFVTQQKPSKHTFIAGEKTTSLWTAVESYFIAYVATTKKRQVSCL